MRRFLLPSLIAALVLVLGACNKGGGAGPGGGFGGMPPTAVETVRLRSQALPNQFETVATLRADESVTVRPEIAGKIEKIHFVEGERVSARQLLFSLDDALARADLNEVEANLKNSTRAHDRATELSGKQLIAKSDLDATTALLSVNQARVASARTRLAKTQIRAPFAGVIGLRNVSAGDYVEVGQELVQLVRLDPIEIDMRAPEVVLSSLSVGQEVEFGVDSFRDERFKAKLVAIAPTVDAGGRSVALRARTENPDLKLRPGMSARARITLSTSAHALLLPEQAIWPNGEQKMVYRVDKGVAKLVPVTLGTRLPGEVEVTSGLKEGDEVVVTGQLKLHDGAQVSTKPASADPVAPSTAATPAG